MKFHASIVQTTYQSPLGGITLAATDHGLAGLWFEGQRHLPLEIGAPTLVASRAFGTSLPLAQGGGAVLARGGLSRRTQAPTPVASSAFGDAPPWPEGASHPVLKKAVQQLSEYFAGERNLFDLPLDLSGGTAFQQAVWQALLDIPRGGTASYSEVSNRVGKPSAMRAVGAAIGRNPVSIIVPCHRVVGMNGTLTGYAGGLDRKTALLKLEGALHASLL
jgi:methylated-DNA-[protein]-cysteine S-methyltransferase